MGSDPKTGQVIFLFGNEDEPRTPLLDEMNIVETPISLLVRDTKLDRIDLTGDGTRYLETTGGRPLPTALAERVVLGLLWLHHERNGLRSRKVEFRLRDLVQQYTHPKEYGHTRPPGKLLKAVREQLHRVAATRLYTSRWYDRRRGIHTEMDASIIDYIQVVQKGGKNRAEVLEIGWGEKFYESIRSRYTKELDPRIYLELSGPLERRLFRWLDRQLPNAAPAGKPLKTRQEVASIQNFARSKMGMTGAVLERGGRTASSYVATKLTKAVENIHCLGFRVRMEIDVSVPDYRLTFLRLDEAPGPNEIVEVDPEGELLRFFEKVVLGATRARKRGAFRARDRELAGKWLEDYGIEGSKAVVEEAHRIQQAGRGRDILTFAGLQLYEAKAVANLDRRSTSAETSPPERETEAIAAPPDAPEWSAYAKTILARSDCEPSVDEGALLTGLEHEYRNMWTMMGESSRARLIEHRRLQLQARELGLLDPDAFREMAQTPERLEAHLREHHALGLDDLGQAGSQASA